VGRPDRQNIGDNAVRFERGHPIRGLIENDSSLILILILILMLIPIRSVWTVSERKGEREREPEELQERGGTRKKTNGSFSETQQQFRERVQSPSW
jgi:hypothetical protein